MGFFKKFNERGNILVFVLVVGWITMIIITGLASYAISENRASRYKRNREQAVQIAEAGIAYYRWHLAHNKEDYQDGTGAPGPYVHDYKDKDGRTIGYYSLMIDAPENGSTIVTVYSTGWLIDQPDSKRTIKVRVGFPAISDYAFLVDGDLIFSSTAFVHGKTHANGRITFNGTSDAPISSAIEVIGSGGPQSYWLFPVPSKDLASVQLQLEEVRSGAQANGLAWPYLPASGAYGYQLTFRADGMVDVSKVITEPACYSDNCYDATDFDTPVTYEIPTSSYIFIDDTIWVNGVVNGRATVATIGNDIIINGDLTYLARDGRHVIGLMTDRNIVFPYNIPDPMNVDAALATVNGTIYRPKYIDNGVGSKDVISAQNFYGSRVSNFSGGMKYMGCGSICSGFLNTNYTYDANLTYRPPAGFPVGSTYNLISWEEVRSTTSTEFIPVSTITITPASAIVPSNSSQQFTASVLPADATVKNVTWSVLGGDTNGRITANGLYTAPNVAGTATILASSGGVVAIANVTITSSGNEPPTIQSQPAANPATTYSATSSLSVLGYDDGGEFNLRYTWSVASKPTGAADPTFSYNNSNAAKNTLVTFSRAGTYQFQVTVTDNNSLTVNSSLVSVTVGQTLTSVVVTPNPVLMAIDTTQQFSATSTDQFGRPMGGVVVFSWSAADGSIDSSGLYTPAQIGVTSVTAASGGHSGNTSVTVAASAPAPTIALSVPRVTGNDPTSNSYDINSNQIAIAFAGSNKSAGQANSGNFYLQNTAGSGGSLTWTQVGTIANTPAGAVGIWRGVPSANLTGVRTRFRSSNTSYDYLKIIIFNGAASTMGTFNKSYGASGSSPSLTVNASAAKSLVYGAGFDNNHAGTDSFNQILTDSWVSGGNHQMWVQELTTSTAGPGNVSFSRTNAGGGWNFAGVEIKSAGPGTQPPTIATAAAASPTTVNGNQTSLSVLGADDGGESNLTYEWNVVSKPTGASDPTFEATNNTNAGKDNTATFYESGNYQFSVTIRDQSGNAITSPNVSVTVSKVLSQISISPPTANFSVGGSPQLFSVTTTDQFGIGMGTTPSITWSATTGTITSGGLYSPPSAEGSGTVWAVSGSVTGTASISITLSGGGGPNCTSGECVVICGDGIVSLGEQCDDGNVVSNDGCSPTCQWDNAPGISCSNVTSSLPSTLSVPIILRDFKGYPETGGHPDFERYMCSVASLGLVQNQLVNGNPVYARSTANPSNGCGTQLTSSTPFSQWYVDTPGVNKTVNDSLILRLVGTSPAVYEYDSILTPLGNTTNTTQLGFFPLDIVPTPTSWGTTPAGGGLNHNFAFTTEFRYWFTYTGGEVLTFSGDDDVWVFINGRLALDIGGLHPRVQNSVTLNSAMATTLGLTVGGAYEVALFHAERHTTQSNFKLTLGGFTKATTYCVYTCGDGVKAPLEECDEGGNNGVEGGSCTIDCKLTGPIL